MPIFHQKLRDLQGLEESFLGHRLSSNPSYGFLPQYQFFLDNQERWSAESTKIQGRILAKVPCDCEAAWIQWREFRSAQAEITSIFFIEIFFRGLVTGLELPRPGKSKTCDLAVRFDPSSEIVYLEVKAQSGQQRGDRHPLSSNGSLFTPHGEEDLSSWLFNQEKISTKNGKLMVPKCQDVAAKGADALLAMIDIFQWETADLVALGKYLAPDFQSVDESIFKRKSLGNAKLNRRYTNRISVVTIVVGLETTRMMCGLREIWLFNESKMQSVLILRAVGAAAILHGSPKAHRARRTTHRTRW
jgi:hypothetical protein